MLHGWRDCLVNVAICRRRQDYPYRKAEYHSRSISDSHSASFLRSVCAMCRLKARQYSVFISRDASPQWRIGALNEASWSRNSVPTKLPLHVCRLPPPSHSIYHEVGVSWTFIYPSLSPAHKYAHYENWRNNSASGGREVKIRKARRNCC